MKNSIRILCLIVTMALMGQVAQAEDVDLSEKPETTSVSLAPYSLGLGAGVITALNPELEKVSPAFMKMSIIQSITFQDRWNMGLDIDWLIPGQNWGGELTVDYLMAQGAFQPFIGAGGGFRYFDKKGTSFGQDIGASGTVHVGMLLDVLDELQLRIRVPFHLVGNEAGDRGIGLDVGFLFSNHHRTTKVRKLKY
jgi:hypothetical protein